MKRKLLKLLLRPFITLSGMERLEQLSTEDLDDLRIASELFQVVDRRPLFRDALDHVVSTIEERIAGRRIATVTRAVVAALYNDLQENYRSVGRGKDSEQCAQRAHALRRGSVDAAVLALVHALGEAKEELLPPLVINSVVRALLADAPRVSAGVESAIILVRAALSAHHAGNAILLARALDQLRPIATTDGYRAIHGFLSSAIAEGRGDREASDRLIAAAVELSAQLSRSDPAYEIATWLRDRNEHRLSERPVDDNGLSVLNRAAEALRRDDPRAVELCELAMHESLSAANKALLRIFAETARRGRGDLASPAAIEACIDRLARDRFFNARHSPIPIDRFLGLLLEDVLKMSPQTGADEQAVRLLDLLAEFRSGAAVGWARGDTLAGPGVPQLSLIDMLSGRFEVTSSAAIRSGFPTHAVVWVNIFTTNSGSAQLVVAELMPGVALSVRCIELTKHQTALLVRCSGQDSEDLGPDEIAEFSELVFTSGRDRHRLLIIPDGLAWEMPWHRLAPATVNELSIVPSGAAALRLCHAALAALPHIRVVGLFDESLVGARSERNALTGLAKKRIIEFDQVSSFEDLVARIRTQQYDVLSIAVHGSSGDGLEYRLLLPESASSPSQLMALDLPPVVVLACCWSNRSGLTRNTITASVGCLAAGATVVVGGAWAIDDAVAGKLMSRTYEAYFRGLPFCQAMRSAYLDLEPEEQVLAAGLTIIGISPG